MSAFHSASAALLVCCAAAAAIVTAGPEAARAQDTTLAPLDIAPYAPAGGGTEPNLNPLTPRTPAAPMDLQDPNATPGAPSPAPAPESAPRQSATPTRTSEDTAVKPNATSITSRYFLRDPASGRSVFEGKVCVNSLKFQVFADRVEIRFDMKNPEKILGMKCSGNVAVRQEFSNSWADKLDYNMVDKVAILTGNVTVEEAGRTIHTKEVHLDTQSGRSIIKGRNNSITLDMKALDPAKSKASGDLLKNGTASGTVKPKDGAKPK